MNLCVTNRCSRRCAYCFQREWFLESPERPLFEMPLELAKATFDIMKVNHFQLLGGEPLLYTHIRELFSICRERRMTVTMLSNITVEPELFDSVVSENLDVISGWLINSDYLEGQEEIFLKNLNALCNYSKDGDFYLGMTVVPDIEQADNYSRRMRNILRNSPVGKRERLSLRISTTTPTGNDVYRVYNYSETLKRIMDSINEEFPHAKFYFDCAPTMCEVDEQFYEYMGERIRQNYNKFCKEPLVDVMPDGSVCWCSSAHFIRIPNIRDYKDGDEVTNALMQAWRNYWLEHGGSGKCKRCDKMSPFICIGWCAGKIAEVKKVMP